MAAYAYTLEALYAYLEDKQDNEREGEPFIPTLPFTHDSNILSNKSKRGITDTYVGIP
jgi:hypothetical protein